MTDGGQSRLETALWGLVLLVGPIGLVWEFGGSILHALPLSGNFPIRFIHHIEVVMYTLVIVLGGGTLLAFIYAATRYSDGVGGRPQSMSVDWGQRTFVAWIGIVIAVLLVTATAGATTLLNVDSGDPPTGSANDDLETAGTITYKVTGVQWTWMVKPTDPKHLPFAMRRTIRVPANTTIKLQITSKDVIHSFAIQKLGVKKDAVPGQMNSYWFVARQPGRYQINCAELCGAGHSQMTPTLVVMPRDEYAEWVVAHGGTNPFEKISVNGTNATANRTTMNTTSTSAGAGNGSNASQTIDAVHRRAVGRAEYAR